MFVFPLTVLYCVKEIRLPTNTLENFSACLSKSFQIKLQFNGTPDFHVVNIYKCQISDSFYVDNYCLAKHRNQSQPIKLHCMLLCVVPSFCQAKCFCA